MLVFGCFICPAEFSSFLCLMQFACWVVSIFIIALLPFSLLFFPLFLCLYTFFSLCLSFICMSVRLSVSLMPTLSGCVVSGLHCGRDDQRQCVVPWHWSYPSPHWFTYHIFHYEDVHHCHECFFCCPFPPITLWPTLLALLHPPIKPWSQIQDKCY